MAAIRTLCVRANTAILSYLENTVFTVFNNGMLVSFLPFLRLYTASYKRTFWIS